MTDTFNTTNMSLTLPVVGTRTGTAYASDINTALIALDAHDHSELNGVRVTPAGLDITSDLDFQGNNIDDARSVRLTDQLANLSGANDITSIYAKEGDLWFNNQAGAQVQVTSGGSLNTGAIVTNVWDTHAISANLTILSSDTYTNILVSSSSAINITLPAANAVSDGRYYVIQDVSGTSQTYAITLTPVSSATINGVSGARTISSQYGTWFLRSDGVSKWMLTYTGFSGLSATSLTYGSNVLSSAGLVLGSSSITPTVLTIGTSTLQTSGLVTTAIDASGNTTIGGTLGVTGATTLTGALTGSSAHLTGSAIIDGDLTVTGTVNINANALGISSISNGTVTNCTITGGTMSGTAISSSTIASPTTSGNNTFVMNSSSTMTFSAARSISRIHPCFNYFSTSGWTVSFPVGFYSTVTAATHYLSLTPIHGATLNSVDLNAFISGASRSPATKLRIGIFRVPFGSSPSTSEMLQSTGALVGVPITSYSFGVWATYNFTMDQNNIIDTTAYNYYVRITEETGSGAIAGNFISSIKLNYSVSDVLAAAM